MKLLLTSAGFTNDSIAKAFWQMVGKKPEETTLAFIPTAANVESGDKSWLINDLVNIKKQNFKEIDIVDISALGQDVWLPRIKKADVLFFGGGNTYHLMNQLEKSGLAALLPEFLKDKIYVGLSAGSIVSGKNLQLRINLALYEEDTYKFKSINCLSLVDFYILPHLNSPHFNLRNEEVIRQAAKGITDKIYALDDQSAIKVMDGKMEIISEGKYLEIN